MVANRIAGVLMLLFAGCGSNATGDSDDAAAQKDSAVADALSDRGTPANDVGVGDGAAADTSTPDASVAVVLPTANAKFDYQLGGAYAPPAGVTVLVRDRNASAVPGLYNICYVNGFQTQPDERAFWEDNHPDLLLRDGGEVVIDPDWNEIILDVTTPEKRTALAGIVGEWIAKCATDGYEAVEIDNLDTYSRSGDLISKEDAVAFMQLLSSRAHDEGLAIAQKNSTELLDQRATMGTDFAIAEECNRWSECQDYVDQYGGLVFVIEYRSEDFDKGCSDFPSLSIILRDLNLVESDQNAYVYDDC